MIQAFDEMKWSAETIDPNPASANIVAFAEHVGTKAIVTVNLTVVDKKRGLGTGEWYFQLPDEEKIYATYVGSAIAFDASTGRTYIGAALTSNIEENARILQRQRVTFVGNLSDGVGQRRQASDPVDVHDRMTGDGDTCAKKCADTPKIVS
ncbi:MAG: hypothetical protein IPP62_04090 [bacterium]|nr:hypothetical protein [bacterium]